MIHKFVRVTLDIELEDDVQELAHKVANRANSIQGVAKAFNERVLGELDEDLDEVLDKIEKPMPSWWDWLKFKVNLYLKKIDSFFK